MAKDEISVRNVAFKIYSDKMSVSEAAEEIRSAKLARSIENHLPVAPIAAMDNSEDDAQVPEDNDTMYFDTLRSAGKISPEDYDVLVDALNDSTPIGSE